MFGGFVFVAKALAHSRTTGQFHLSTKPKVNLEPGNLKRLPDFEPFPGYHGKMIHSDQMTVGHWKIDRGFSIPDHAHPHQQIVNVVSGEFELTVAGTSHHLGTGDYFIIPGNVPHSGRSVSDCYLIDVWHPPRDDYRTTLAPDKKP